MSQIDLVEVQETPAEVHDGLVEAVALLIDHHAFDVKAFVGTYEEIERQKELRDQWQIDVRARAEKIITLVRVSSVGGPG